MSSIVSDMLCEAIGQIDDHLQAGDVGQPGDCLHDELDACTSLLSYVRDRISDPGVYLTLATKQPAAGQLMAAIHAALLLLADARWQLQEVVDEPVIERAVGGVETATLPEGELRSAC